jgi:formate dehydrogenase major subunit
MLQKRRAGVSSKTGLAGVLAAAGSATVDRRAFLRKSGVAAGGLAALGAVPLATVRKAEAGPMQPGVPIEIKKNICTHCSVGCTVTAEVQNGVWVGQEPAWASPINRGTHCAKGASVREIAHGDRRLKYPMKLSGGEWQRLSWEQAIDEIGAKLEELREESGPDSVFWLGSAKFSNEGSYLFRKLAAMWGTNSVDHQARICHSTTVAGVANTWGYGAMTNSYNDIANSKAIMIIGGNPAEAHPVSLQHVLRGKELNQAPMIVCDPRFTRTAAHATHYVRLRPGTDIPLVWGMLWHIFENGLEDKEYIAQRVHGMDQIRAEVAKWHPAEVERVTGVPGAQVAEIARIMATQKPSTLIWCMGVTQHTVGTANVRALSILQLALGNIGIEGGGANIFRGHCNVQGATDLGLDVTSLPAYYGLSERAWRHWSRVWDLDYEWVRDRFGKAGMTVEDKQKLMEAKGIPTTRWFDAVLADPADVDQPDRLRGMVVFGHGGNTVPRMPEMRAGLEALDLLVVADPHPTTFAAVSERKDGTYLLPICTQFECNGSRTASNRSLQWGNQIVEPLFESKNDYEAMYLLSKRLGIEEQMFKHIQVDGTAPLAEDILREINRGTWSIGYTGQSPERLKQHMEHQGDFDMVSLRGKPGTPVEGEVYGLPWPCFGTPEIKHPGTHILYNTHEHVMKGGGTFRARFGVERDGETLLAEGSWSKGSEIEDGYPEFTYGILKTLGWDGDLTAEELATIQKIGGDDPDSVSWAIDLSGGIQRVSMAHGCVPYGNAKARAVAWNLPDPVPVHREPIYSPRPELVAEYQTYEDKRDFRVMNIGHTIQAQAVKEGTAGSYPIILTTGRLVEYEGGGEETRSNKWLAELQQSMFVEVNRADAARLGVKDGGMVWVYGPAEGKVRVKALVTNRVGEGVAFMPFHFSGYWEGESQRAKYPEGADPIVLGDSANACTTYGYDPVTAMHEGKATLCRIEAA